MFCAQCGQPYAGGAKFCAHCGAATPVAAQPAPQPPAERPRPAPEAAAPLSAAPGAAPAMFGAAPASASAAPAFDTAQATELARGIFARVKNILLSPATEWPVIAAEPSSSGAIYLRYVAPLIAIGVIASFIGETMVGTSAGILGTVRVGFVFGFGAAIVKFAFGLLGVFVISWLVDVLAPTFGGQRDSLRALKVTAYSCTASWVASVLLLVPSLAIVVFLAGLYGLYLMYLGLPILMRCPADKSIGYTIAVVLGVIAMLAIIGLGTCVIGGLGLMGAMSRHGGMSESATAKADTAGVLANIFGGKSDADRENAVGPLMAGGKDIQPVDFHELRAMLPASLPGMQRNEASGQSGEAMGMKGSSATGRYSDGANATISIEIVDLGSLSGLAALAGKFDPSMEKETATGYERTTKVNGQLVHERYDRRAKSGEVGVMVANRFSVTVEGSGVDPGALTGALKAIDLASLATMRATK
jgi:hypothetical protein